MKLAVRILLSVLCAAMVLAIPFTVSAPNLLEDAKWEMIEVLAADLFAKNLVPRGCSWWVVYDYKSLEACPGYDGPLSLDFYGRVHPKHSVGRVRLPVPTNDPAMLAAPLLAQFDEKTDHRLLYRRLGVAADDVKEDQGIYQLDFFTDYESKIREQKITGAMREIRLRYGANSVLKGINFLEGATTKERNTQIGGHRA